VTTIAGNDTSLFGPTGITIEGRNLYITEPIKNTIKKIEISTGVVTTLAGTAGTLGCNDGTGAEARFFFPRGITTDGTNLHLADSANNTIRMIVISTGVVTTLAGTSPKSWMGSDETDSSAPFENPNGITTDGTYLYVADSGNHRIQEVVISTGEVSTLAGMKGSMGSDDGHGTSAQFNWPSGITMDGKNLYVADSNNNTIRKIEVNTGLVTTIAGMAGTPGSRDGMGEMARFDYPWGITSDGTNLYVTDVFNHIIRKIVISTGEVTTFAGAAGRSGNKDGIKTVARFFYPYGITTDGTNLYVADTSNSTIRKILISK
jgi:sugar lactone lactonase YvrE